MTVTERFLKYVTFETTSDESSDTVPSTATQLVLADYLVEELRGAGVTDAMRDEMGYVYGHIPASDGCENCPKIGLVSHMDTSPDVSGANVKPQIIKFDGTNAPMVGDEYIGRELIVTDHTTLLGADDKAGVAEIVALCAEINANKNIRHGALSICFTPDEEIGSGADHFDFERFNADFAYTVDGGEVGGIECENFNAAAADITVHGVNTHPGTAKNKMKNAILLANQFISLLPAAEAPAHTEGYEGFYHVTDLAGNESQVVLHAIIRDHDLEKFNARKAFVERLAAYLNDQWGRGTFRLEMRDSYYNMKEKIRPHMELIENAKAAMEAVGVEPVIVPIRGGTDGARLSWERDIPCPNLCTGGANFHGVHEFIPVPSMEKMVQVLVELVKA